MRTLVFSALVLAGATAAADAAPGVTTTSVNFREGPGTNYSVIRTLPAARTFEIGGLRFARFTCPVRCADNR